MLSRRWRSRFAPSLVIGLVVLVLYQAPIGTASDPGAARSPVFFPSAPTGSIEVAPAFEASAGVEALGPLPASAPLQVAVLLAPSDPSALSAALTLEYTAGSPEYHQFLSPSDVASYLGTSPTEYAAAVAYFQSYGLTVNPSPDRFFLSVTGNPEAMGAAFGTSFSLYSNDGQVFFSHSSAAHLPAGIPWAGVVGLGNESAPLPSIGPLQPVELAPSGTSCPLASFLTPCQVRSEYNESLLLANGTNGSGVQIGVVDTYDGSEPQSTLSTDLAQFGRSFGVPVGTVRYLYPVPTTQDLNATSNDWGTEDALDLEWARAMAPAATIDMTFAPNWGAGLYAAVDWLVAHQAVDVLSLSWGEPDVGIFNDAACVSACNASSDGSYALLHPILMAAAAEGIGVFAASGDCGAADGTEGLSTNYPASDPWVTGVGGTVVSGTGTGNYSVETGWSGDVNGTAGCNNQGGSGGGFSPYPKPLWQTGPGVPAGEADRGVPDVAAIAGSRVFVVEDGNEIAAGGTSASTPMWAGVAALADQFAGDRLGFLDPSLYSLFRSTNYSAAFHDVTHGWNGYYAGPGWDPVTGIGTPDVGVLVADLARSVPARENLSVAMLASPRYGSAPLTVRFIWTDQGGSRGYPLTDLVFGDGNASLASNGSFTYTYDRPGVYVAQAVVYDSSGNSSLSPPITIVVGSGLPLGVALNVSTSDPAVGAGVTFSTTATGGTAPYQFYYGFGDGTYLNWTDTSVVSHTYGVAAAVCADVVVRDAASAVDGGSSSLVPLTVGSARPANCTEPAPLRIGFTSSILSADLPGDLPLRTSVQGGMGPVAVRLVSNDSYASACQCGIFRLPGSHVVKAYASDSFDEWTMAELNVTLYPALTGDFQISRTNGTAPLSVRFSASLSGGHDANANDTTWTFGDGTETVGAIVDHTYTTPGSYLALGRASDDGGGVASEAFLIDVLASNGTGQTILTANVTPAFDVPAGTPILFRATASGDGGPYVFHWEMGANVSAFGNTVEESFTQGCGGSITCPLSVDLTALSARGQGATAGFTLPTTVQGSATALRVTDSVSPTHGSTPLIVTAEANGTGMPYTKVSWTFGDGATAVGAKVHHTYITPGNYTVTEIVSDAAGDWLPRTHAVTVTGLALLGPNVSGGPNRTTGVAPFAVNFSAVASGGAGAPYSYSWSFGDGGSSSNRTVEHTYLSAGLYNASLMVEDRLGEFHISDFVISVYNVTSIALSIVDLSSGSSAGDPFSFQVLGSAVCRTGSFSPCGTADVDLLVELTPAGGTTGPVATSTAALALEGASGRANLTESAPTSPGNYVLRVSSLGPYFLGTASANLTVTRSDPYPTPFQSLITGMLAGATVGLFVMANRRHRRRPDAEGVAPIP